MGLGSDAETHAMSWVSRLERVIRNSPICSSSDGFTRALDRDRIFFNFLVGPGSFSTFLVGFRPQDLCSGGGPRDPLFSASRGTGAIFRGVSSRIHKENMFSR